jgi:rsbT co-antagonist protein RsbR
MAVQQTLGAVLRQHRRQIQQQWMRELLQHGANFHDGAAQAERGRQVGEFLDCLVPAVESADIDDIDAPEWKDTREFLDQFSHQRAVAGLASDDTASFIFSLKHPVFAALCAQASGAHTHGRGRAQSGRAQSGRDAARLAADVWDASMLLDRLGLYTIKVFQKSYEAVIQRQQQELLELSTPVVKLWEGILALPMIGTLDSARAQVVMESLLQRIVETGSQIAIIDITGVPTVDTLVAQYLLKTATALRLMGAECIISGVRPQIAQTIVHLGVDLQALTTKATLADALALALQRTGASFAK